MPTPMSDPPAAYDPSPAATDQSDAHLWIHPTFWQQKWVQDLLPLVTSIIVHMAPVLIALLIIGPYQIIRQSVQREQVIIPEAAMVEGAPVGGVLNPGLGGDPNLSAAQNTDAATASDGWASKKSETLTATLLGGAAPDAADSIIGLGVRSGVIGSGAPGVGGSSSQGGGAMAPFGVGGGGMGAGPSSPFMGISGNARRVVYICDASGSMMSVYWKVKQELHKAVGVLKAMQSFNVIFFSDIDVTALSKSDLVVANAENVRKAIELSERMSAAGTTDPLPAIRMAFAQKPELIYVLTDGFDQVVSFDAVINEFRRLNPDKKIKVNTILIRSSGNADLENVMKTIARENGGVCQIIDRQDM